MTEDKKIEQQQEKQQEKALPTNQGVSSRGVSDKVLQGFQKDVSHQEISRIFSEVEELFFASGADSLPVGSIAQYLCMDLGYDDDDEFEDALGGSFMQFLQAHPRCELLENADVAGGWSFKIIKKDAKPAQRLTLKITNREELWRVCLFAKSPAKIIIPELEFEIMGADKTTIDSIYNHLANAIKNLEQHVETNPNAGNSTGIKDTIIKLRSLLDLDSAFTWVIEDKEGLCEINPEENVRRELI